MYTLYSEGKVSSSYKREREYLRRRMIQSNVGRHFSRLKGVF